MRRATSQAGSHTAKIGRARRADETSRGLQSLLMRLTILCMRYAVALVVFLIAVFACAQQPQVPEIGYQSVPDFLKLPSDIYLGEVAGVAVNSKGHVFVFSRGNTTGPAYGASAAQLLEFDADGQFLREIGHNLYAWSFAHSVKVDKEDNIWVADKGSDMVIKFNPEGRVVMVFGRKQEASDEGTEPLKHPKPPLPPVDGMFRQVTDMAWDAAGTLTSAMATSIPALPKSTRTATGSSRGANPATGRDSSVRRIASPRCGGHIYVADRGNRRIQVFDTDGKFLRQITIDYPSIRMPVWRSVTTGTAHQRRANMAPGAPWAICITPAPHQVLYASDAYPGRIYKLSLDGKVLGVLGESGKQLKQFGWIHEIACPSENVLFVAELLNWRVQKLILEPSH